mgnify:CR=1 FL=1
MSQKKQILTLDDFRNGVLNVLVATSVGEEGLDIPSADRVIFFEPVSSEIRTIQRRGRTGRHREGYVYVLISKDTRDEGIRYASAAKEIRMHRILKKVKNQRSLSFKFQNNKSSIKRFDVFKDGKNISAKHFIESEEKRLKENININPIGKDNIKTSENIITPQNNYTLSQKLRPIGQFGLEQFDEEE